MAGLMSQHIGGSSTTIPQSGLLAQRPVGLLQGFPTYTGPEKKPVATKPARLKYEQDRLRAMIQQQKMAELMSQNIGGGSTPQEGLMPRQPMGSMQGFPTYTGPESKPLAVKPESAQQLKNFSAEDLPNTILKAKSREDVTESVDGPFVSSGTEFTRSMANLPTNHKFIAESEFSEGNFKDLGSKPYVSSTLAGELNLKGKSRSITDVKDVPNTNSIHGDKVKSGKTGLTIGFGHDISPQELKSGEIHGVPFVKDGKFIDVGVEALTEIFNADFEHHKGRAERTFNSKVGNSVGYKFEELPTEVQDFMTDIDFNMGLTEIPKSLAIIKSIISTALRTKRGITEVSMEPVLNVLEKEIKERDTKNPKGSVQRRSNKAFKYFRTREGLKSLFKLKGN
jgi:hypothetical protein